MISGMFFRSLMAMPSRCLVLVKREGEMIRGWRGGGRFAQLRLCSAVASHAHERAVCSVARTARGSSSGR